MGGVFLGCLYVGSSSEASDSGLESAPNGAGDARRELVGPSFVSSTLNSAEGGLARGVNGDVAPYMLVLRSKGFGKAGVRGVAFMR